jgi:histidine 2-aminobutanoyltransferase
MKIKYELLMSLQLFKYEIKKLTNYSLECRECYELLQNRLDYLCSFITSQDKVKQWDMWGEDREISECCSELRDASIKALCDIEKYNAYSFCCKKAELNSYILKLSNSLIEEVKNSNIEKESKVLFIGSGAFPTSAFVIAGDIGAEVTCLDIDIEAVKISKQLIQKFGLESKIDVLCKKIENYKFIKEATHIIVASLVSEKMEILKELKKNINRETKIIMRYGNGLKSIFNYPLEAKIDNIWEEISIKNSNSIYDTLILKLK